MQTRPGTSPQADAPSLLSRVAGLGCLALLTCLILQGITLLLSALPSGEEQRAAQPVGSQSLSSPALPSFAASASIIPLHTPGGPADGAAYVPSDLSVPAQSLVTLTIRNYDLGDTPLPATSPYAVVQGVQGSATMDGHPYQALSPARVAHTFTIPALRLNVPIPGDAAPGAAFVTVTFTFRTGAAGIYMWQCFDPCGQGQDGESGPMGTMGDMMGYLIIQG
jgi:hypothetical protein